MFVRSFTKEIDEATQFVRERLGILVLTRIVTAAIMVGIVIGTILFGGITVGILLTTMPKQLIAIEILGGFICAVFILVGCYIMEGCNIIQGEYYYKGNKMDVTDSLGKVTRKFLKLMGYACLQIISIIPFIIVGILLGYIMISKIDLYKGQSPTTSIVVLSAFLVVIGIVLFIFLGSIYKTCFLFGLSAIVIDDLGPIKALIKSFSLIRKEFWKTFKKVFLFNLGIYGCNLSLSLLVTLIIGIIVAFITIVNSTSPLALMEQLSVLMDWPTRIISVAVIGAFNGAITAHLYDTQKCKKEGADLRRMLAKLKCSEEQSI